MDGHLSLEDLSTLMTLTDSSDAAILTALFRLSRRLKSMPVIALAEISIRRRSDLAQEILRAVVQALPSQLQNATLGGLSALQSLNNTLAMEALLEFAMGLADAADFHQITRRTIAAFEALRDKAVAVIQSSFALEVKRQVFGAHGGVLVGAEGDVEVVIPARAVMEGTVVELHTYDCQRVSAFEEEEAVLCHSISPHLFREKVTVHFNVPDDRRMRRCFKASDEIGDDWRRADCYFTEGRATYISTEFSVVTARLTNYPAFVPDPNIQTTLAEIPYDFQPSSPLHLPLPRFQKYHERSPSGMHAPYLLPLHSDTTIAGAASGIDIGMHGMALDAELGIIYWSNGVKIEYVLVEDAISQTPFTGAPQTLYEGSVRVDIEGENLGKDRADLIGVRVAENADCEPRGYLSSKRVVCDIVHDYAQVASNPLLKIDRASVLVSTHRRDKSVNRGIPTVDHVRVHPIGRKPRALFFEQDTRTLIWSDSEFGHIVAAPLAHGGKRFNGSVSVVIEGCDAQEIGFDPSTFQLYYLDRKSSSLARVKVNSSFAKAGTVEVLLQEPHLASFSLDLEIGRAVLAQRFGVLLSVDLNPPFTRKVLLQRNSKSRLSSVVVSANDSDIVFVADQESSEILQIQLSDPHRPSVVARSAVWAVKLLATQERIYWSEYLGQVWGIAINEQPSFKFLLDDQTGVQRELMRDLRTVKTGYLELIAES